MTGGRISHAARGPQLFLLLAVACLTPIAARAEPPPPRPSPSPRIEAMLEYSGLGIDELVFKRLAHAMRAQHPALARLVGMYAGDLSQRRVTHVLSTLLPEVKDEPRGKRQVLLLAIDHLAPWLANSASGRTLMARYGLHAHPDHNGEWLYNHDDLWRAWKLDPGSEWGKDAFVLLLESGFDPSHDCLFGPDNFRRVIRYGAPWLRSHSQDPRALFVTFTLARAYHTWWVLGHTENPAYRRYIPGSQAAYREAVDRYEQVIHVLTSLPPAAYSGAAESNADLMLDAARGELRRLQQRQIDFSAFYCVRHE